MILKASLFRMILNLKLFLLKCFAYIYIYYICLNKQGDNPTKQTKLSTMKTVTFKKTTNGRYVACVLPIRGQQSSNHFVEIFDAKGNFIKTENVHPMFSWVNYCTTMATVATIYDIDKLQECLQLIIAKNFTGYTTAMQLKSNDTKALITPIGLI